MVDQTDFSQPMTLVNDMSLQERFPDWNESAFWDALIAHQLQLYDQGQGVFLRWLRVIVGSHPRLLDGIHAVTVTFDPFASVIPFVFESIQLIQCKGTIGFQLSILVPETPLTNLHSVLNFCFRLKLTIFIPRFADATFMPLTNCVSARRFPFAYHC